MNPKVIQVIQSETIRGDGRMTVMRAVIQYHTLDGEFLAENDPLAGKNDLVKNCDFTAWNGKTYPLEPH